MIGFGEFGMRKMEIRSLSDERLMRIDPTVPGFFDKVLNFKTTNKLIKAYLEAVDEVKDARLEPFWRPVMDPSEIGGKVVYVKGKPPAVGHSYNWWKAKAEKMPSVEGSIWLPGSEYQYYADEVDLINQLVAKGVNLEQAIKGVVINSAQYGHYVDSEGATGNFESTGSRELCGRYDFGNTCKMLRCTNKETDGCWIAGGNYDNNGNVNALADLDHDLDVDLDRNYSVGWLVLCSTEH